MEKKGKIKYPLGLVNKMGYRTFGELADEIGFSAARQRLKDVEIVERERKSQKVEKGERSFQGTLLLQEKIKLSRTLGAPTLDNPVSKMRGLSKTFKKRKMKNLSEEEKKEEDQIEKELIAVKRSWSSGDLNMPQSGITKLPSELGKTMSLQLGHFKRLSLPRNKLSLLTSTSMPQFSLR